MPNTQHPVPNTHLWHAIPLHYLPRAFSCGALYAATMLPAGVIPRHSVAKRAKKLGLDGFVYLSLTPSTPLLADKRARGYPHALLAFPPELLESPTTALVRYNAKSWRHRDDFAPVTDPDEKRATLDQWRQGKYPSLEAVVPRTLPLHQCGKIVFATAAEQDWWTTIAADFCLSTPETIVRPETFPAGIEPDLAPLIVYADTCRHAKTILDPPHLPFD